MVILHGSVSVYVKEKVSLPSEGTIFVGLKIRMEL